MQVYKLVWHGIDIFHIFEHKHEHLEIMKANNIPYEGYIR